MPGAFANIPNAALSVYDSVKRNAGTTFTRLEDNRNYSGYFRILPHRELQEMDFEVTEADNLNPKILDLLDLTCPIIDGDFVLCPSIGNVLTDRYEVTKVHTIYAGNTPLFKKAILFLAPEI